MKLTETKLRSIIREELMREARGRGRSSVHNTTVNIHVAVEEYDEPPESMVPPEGGWGEEGRFTGAGPQILKFSPAGGPMQGSDPIGPGDTNDRPISAVMNDPNVSDRMKRDIKNLLDHWEIYGDNWRGTKLKFKAEVNSRRHTVRITDWPFALRGDINHSIQDIFEVLGVDKSVIKAAKDEAVADLQRNSRGGRI